MGILPLDDYAISHIRTFTPLLVGALIAYLASRNITLAPQTANALVILLVPLFSAAYYSLIRLFETHASPRFGWLLGFARTPQFIEQGPSGK